MGEQRVEAVERALSILEAFNESARRLSLAELAEETGLYKSTILRLIASLTRYGYIMRGEDGRYQLGASLWRLGALYRKNFELGEHVRPVLRELVQETGETASFYVREADERICLYRENSCHAIRHHLDEGSRLPIDRGASAHVLRAWVGGEEERDVVMREKGYAISIGERIPDVAAIGAPVIGKDGQLRGALELSGLASRFDEGALRAAAAPLMRCAQQLSGILD